MPLYYFRCGSCNAELKKLLPPAEAKAPRTCECGGAFVRAPRPPSNQVVERLDNGFMTKAVERPADAERLYRERAENDPRFK